MIVDSSGQVSGMKMFQNGEPDAEIAKWISSEIPKPEVAEVESLHTGRLCGGLSARTFGHGHCLPSGRSTLCPSDGTAPGRDFPDFRDGVLSPGRRCADQLCARRRRHHQSTDPASGRERRPGEENPELSFHAQVKLDFVGIAPSLTLQAASCRPTDPQGVALGCDPGAPSARGTLGREPDSVAGLGRPLQESSATHPSSV